MPKLLLRHTQLGHFYHLWHTNLNQVQMNNNNFKNPFIIHCLLFLVSCSPNPPPADNPLTFIIKFPKTCSKMLFTPNIPGKRHLSFIVLFLKTAQTLYYWHNKLLIIPICSAWDKPQQGGEAVWSTPGLAALQISVLPQSPGIPARRSAQEPHRQDCHSRWTADGRSHPETPTTIWVQSPHSGMLEKNNPLTPPTNFVVHSISLFVY